MVTRKKIAKVARKERFSRYDTADYLRSGEDLIAYLNAVMEEATDDPTLIAVALGNVARAHGMLKLSRETGLTREGLYRALSERGNPNLATITKVMQALGLRLAVQAA